MKPILSFHGAAGGVTGSCTEIRTDKAHILVDCGMFQGSKTLKHLNYETFPFDPRSIDAVVLTHAHIDHSGLLPKLMRAGYHGPIYATAATRDLCTVMLADAGGIQESEVEHLNHRNQRRGWPLVQPIYTARDAALVMDQFEKVKLNEPAQVAPGITATYWPAGHIVGAASIELAIEGEGTPLRILFSGDIGPGGSEFVADPKAPTGINHLVLESTYGDRERTIPDAAARRRLLAAELIAAEARGGPLLIPAFAVERSQELLADLVAVMEDGQAPEGAIFLDSPLGIRATDVFLQRGWNTDSGRNPFEDVRPSSRLRFLPKPWDSDTLERLRGWHVIMASSGMCDAGRIRRHLKRLLWRKETTVLLSGFQAAGTLGRLLADGAKRVTIQGDEIRVQAEIRQLDVYSGHADAKHLVDWARARTPVEGVVFLNHGEPNAVSGLARRLTAAGFAQAKIIAAPLDQEFELGMESASPVAGRARPPRLETAAVAALDWHNARTQFLLQLEAALASASSDAGREALLRRLGGQLAETHPAPQQTALETVVQ